MATLMLKKGAGYWALDRYPFGGEFHRAGSGENAVEIVKLIETVWQRGARYIIGITSDGRKVSVDDSLVVWKASAEESKPFPEEMEGPNHFDR